MTTDSQEPFAFLDEYAEDTDQFSAADGARVIGLFVWELVGRSFWRLIFIFISVFLGGFLPAGLIVLALTLASQTYTRTGLMVVVALCLIPLSAIASFNFTAYRGLRDIADRLAFGKKMGASLVAFIEPTDRMRIPINDFTDRLKAFLTKTRNEVPRPKPLLQRIVFRVTNTTVFFTVRFVLNRLAKDCVVDGEVDLERFAIGVGERADGLLIVYFKKFLWDLTRLVLAIGVFVIWFLLALFSLVLRWLSIWLG
ncbi:hypothetical protein [Algisphaera agarilytica]|uniref:Uncharacterized protein n=1 Tax=Algisphaera agarilytica TaxID=1385975 RepID=A0A7X0H6Y9_9BACT|nr:hypothetical protein [Algisphaera agarilytica]MBB6430207.1 hypothetical protein [Algisphaera agarilytica]